MSNVVLNPGVGGATCATDQISAVDHQLVKVEWGAAGTANQTSYSNPLPVTLLPIHGGSGLGFDYHKVSAASNNAALISTGAHQVYGVHGFNAATYPVFIKLYDKATGPIPGTDTPFRTIGIQAGVRADDLIPYGISVANGLGVAIVKGIADADNTAVASGDCVIEVDYL